MAVTNILLFIVLIMCILNFIALISTRKNNNDIEKIILKLESSNKDEFSRNRSENSTVAKELRLEVNNSIELLTKSISTRMLEIGNMQKNMLDTFSAQLINLTNSNNDSLHKIRETLETNVKAMQEDNNKKLEKMRETVDEKLHKTLEQRLGESFKLVSERLELVHKGLGEMQNLATGVGDLKKVLSNVKTRGIFGELQLEGILEQILTAEQYDKNVVTKKGSRDNVEFAVKLPGKDDEGSVVYLPLDSKFPLDMYYNLMDAYEAGDLSRIDECSKALESTIKKCAKDIRDKYIDPPNTTEFAIMFLPIEGLFAEVAKRTNLLEIIQREYKINITGPTTLAALLSSLQMGFKTLAIERRSSEVWKVLGAVKTEFEKFGTVLNKTQEKLNQASNELDTLVGTRTRQIVRKLKDIQSVSQIEGENYINFKNIETEE